MYRRNGNRRQKVQVDFTSALYLGMNHDTSSLMPWEIFTTGVPAALKEPANSRQVAKAIAGLQGMDDGLLYSSTLHLFWDLFESLSTEPIAVFLDDKAYPIAKWGVDRAILKGVPIHTFSHNKVSSLLKSLKNGLKNRRPVIVTDGWCPQCGKAAPIRKYLKILRPYNGLIVVDDTQALGILGKQANPVMPYGYGGGGVLPWLGIKNKNLITGSSLAKGFGVPLAVLCGNSFLVKKIKELSRVRVHCSPPSSATLSAAMHALKLNNRKGNFLRQELLKRIDYFRKGLQRLGIKLQSGYFPVQTITNLGQKETMAIYQRLKQNGIHPILIRAHKHDGADLTFILTAIQPWDDLKTTLELIAQTIALIKRTRNVKGH